MQDLKCMHAYNHSVEQEDVSNLCRGREKVSVKQIMIWAQLLASSLGMLQVIESMNRECVMTDSRTVLFDIVCHICQPPAHLKMSL
jgi:hypothetical protein